MILILVFLLPALFYSLTFLALLQGLRRVVSHNSVHEPFVSVIVSARNEERNILPLLHALQHQSYSQLETIIVDDASSDKTLEIIRDFQKPFPRTRLIQITQNAPKTPSRKKRALTSAIEASNGEILLFTDADCIPPPQWVEGMIREFSPSIGIVAGYSPYLPDDPPGGKGFLKTLLHEFIRYEEIKGALWSAGAIGLEIPWLCTGRNLAYRRSVWDEVGGFNKILHSMSGDDDLFLQLVTRETPWKAQYCLNPATFVPTTPPGTLGDFTQQRKRHFSAGRFFSTSMKVFSLAFHTSNLLLVVGFFLGLFWPALFSFGFWMFLVKIAADGILIMRGSKMLQERNLILRFILMEFLYVGYTTLIGPLGFLSTSEWKPDSPQ